MKHIFTLAVAVVVSALALTSCEDKPKNQPWDPNAMVSLRPDIDKAAQAPTKANPEHLTPLEIVKQTHTISWITGEKTPRQADRGFGDHQRDTITPKLLMWGTDIITQFGEYLPDFIEGKEIILRRLLIGDIFDTIAYVPKSTLIEAQKIIRPAYEAGDYETCYRVFNEAFTFIPITADEWRNEKNRGDF